MPNTLKEQGFTHLLAVLVFGFLAVLLTSSLIPINRHFNDGKSNVAGVYLAKDGNSDDSGASSGSSGPNSGKSGSSDEEVGPSGGGKGGCAHGRKS